MSYGTDPSCARVALPWKPAVVGLLTASSAAALLVGCVEEHAQSSLHPAGAGAESIARLWWFLFAVLGAVFLATMLLAVIALTRPRLERAGPPLGAARFVAISGILVPAAILVVLMFATLRTTTRLREPETDLRVRVVGHRWWWEVHYPDLGIATANQIHIPVGRAVRFDLVAADVIHSFWVPNLGGKMDMVPEHANAFWLRADRAGTFRGQCAEYCGMQHALMAFTVEAVPAEEFEAWVAARRRPRNEAEDPVLTRGRDAFFHPDAGCYTCHAIRGTPARGVIGPDLTHIGSRRTLAAGTIPNTPENLTRWILDPQGIKPGNRMPATEIEKEELEAMVAYLMSLE